MNVLDAYIAAAPKAQNALDLFAGEWSSEMPTESGLSTTPGPAGLFNDDRVIWAKEQFGGFEGNRILELGPLEAGHSYMLEKAGADEVVAIESNSRAYLKCLCIKEAFELQRTKFLLGDFMPYLENTETEWDVVFASGVLYHMMDPLRMLDLASKRASKLFIWTHYYDEGILSARADLTDKFEAVTSMEHAGHKYDYSAQSYAAALEWPGFCGGPEETSKWLTRSSLFDALANFGFSKVETGFDDPDHQNGPAIAICATK